MILDLVLPIEVFGDCNAKNGTNFLNEIGINPSIHPPIHIVGISGYKEQVSEYNDDFSKKLWNLIDYEENSSNWEDQLKSIIFHTFALRFTEKCAAVGKVANCCTGTLEKKIFLADVAKLVDASDLGSDAARHGGSSPSIRTL